MNLQLPVGFICSLGSCVNQGICPGHHYDYYSQPQDDLVAISVDEVIRYIHPDGFRTYYEQQLNNINHEARCLNRAIDDNLRNLEQPPSKRRRLF